MNIIHFLIIALAVIGLYIAAYFTLVYYGLLRPSTRLMPSVCRLKDRTCQTVLTTKYAHLFGVPNSLLGVFYYLAVIVLLSAGWTSAPVGTALIAAAWFAVAVGFLLVYSLFFIIRIPCPLCLAGHAINLLLALLLTLGLR